ncbi:MAG: protein BatD [Ignavibacteriaceae bacterium]|nr:protein BatD [Ignavibacteriaceae bacterium]
MNFLKIFTAIYLVLGVELLSQSFSASVNSTTVPLNDRFELSFTFEGQDINAIKGFTPPDLNKDFLVLSGPNQSTSMQIINGAVSASISYSYYLQPRNLGKYTISSAKLFYKDREFKTDPIKIEVIAGSTKPKQTDQSNDNVSEKEIGENLFIRAIVDKQKVYKGEQVTVTYKLYTRLDIAAQMSVSKLPSYQGFWAEELETSPNISFSNEVINGKQFRVGIIKRAALFPSQTGELSLTPFELKVPILEKKKRGTGNIFDDFFDDPFFGRRETYEYTARSNTAKVTCIDLPKENVPANFKGAVGDFILSAKIDKEKVKANEPIALKVEISGTGNMQLITVPEIKLPTGFEKYEPKISEQINRTSTISGKKTIDYLIVPRLAGKVTIAPIEFSYFNPRKKTYESLNSSPFTIEVMKGDAASDFSGVPKEEIKLLDNDIRYLKVDLGNIEQNHQFVLMSYWFWGGVALPLIGLIGLIAWRKRDERISANLQLLRYQRAQKMAKSRLKIAKNLMTTNNYEAFYAEISKALFGYLEDKLHIPKSEFSLEYALEQLTKKNIKPSILDDLKSVAEKCEYARFAPPKIGQEGLNQIYDASANVIIEIEKALAG